MSLEMLLSDFIKDVNGSRRYLEVVKCENIKVSKMVLNMVVYGYDEGYIDLVGKDEILNVLLEEAEKNGLNEEIENIKYWIDYI